MAGQLLADEQCKRVGERRLAGSYRRELFVNAWNEWAEKAVLEPSEQYGRALLDWLALRFIDSGWSIKDMHRLIMRSRVYQLDSHAEATPEQIQADPDNDYLWHFARRRLDAESIRDTILAVSGSLDRTPGGAHPFPKQTTWDFTQHKPFKAVYDTSRRSVYLMTQRIQRHPFLALFDGPDTNASTGVRTTSTTPLQALFLMIYAKPGSPEPIP